MEVIKSRIQKVMKRLMYFSPPTKCFYKDALSNILHTISSETLRQTFYLVLVNFEAVQSQQFKLPYILLAFCCCCFRQK